MNGMTIQEKIEALKAYLRMKVEEGDWHAVSDAANDLRVLEAKEEAWIQVNLKDVK